MAKQGALAGLRVLDLTDESGRLAGKLLAEQGADVLRLGVNEAGAPVGGARRPGVLNWWYDAGVRRLPVDLNRAEGIITLRNLAARADLFIETERPGRLKVLGLDYPDLARLNPMLVQVSLTPYGRTGPRAEWQVSDLVAGALGGVLSVTGDPERPLNGYGRQAFHAGGFSAALSGLAAVYAARTGGEGQHIDLSLQQCVVSCTEQVLMQWFFPGRFAQAIAQRQRSLHWTRAYEVMECARGHTMITPAIGLPGLLAWMHEDGMAGDFLSNPPRSAEELTQRMPRLMEQLRAWARTKDAEILAVEGQRRHLPFGAVHTLAEAAAGPQLTARGFWRQVSQGETTATVPGPLFRMSETPAPPPSPPPARRTGATAALRAWPPRDASDADLRRGRDLLMQVLGGEPTEQGVRQFVSWARGDAVAPSDEERAPGAPPLDGIRVLDFTQVLAGPFATRVLADLGADVIKLQTEVRSRGAHGPEHPYFVMWNRGKRAAMLNMKHPRAVETLLRLVRKADIVIENFSAGVLASWGAGWEQLHAANPRLIAIALSGCGQDGPWRDYVSYAPTIHALCGLTYLTNHPGERDAGYGFALTDHVSGLAGAFAALTALEARRRSGRGQFIDLSQLEVGAYLLGPAFVEYFATGNEPHPAGNRDPYADYVPNEVYRCADGRWLAVTARDDAEWRAICRVISAPELGRDAALATVAGRRAARERVDAALAAWCAGREAGAAMLVLQAADVPAGVVQNAQDLVERDAGLAARDWLAGVVQPYHGEALVDRYPGTFSGTPLEEPRPVPLVGEHTFEVFRELLGMSDEEIAEGMAEGLFT